MTEEWRAVPGWEPYEASSEGRIRRGNLIRTFQVTPNGYLSVNLSVDGKPKRVSVHSIVAQTFLGERPAGLQTAHLDGDKKNPRVANLAYVTPQENCLHKRDHGTMFSGERHNKATLTLETVEYIRSLDIQPYSRTNGFRAIGKLLGVSNAAVEAAYRGKNWKQSNIRASERVR